jgi:hypothetical protein
MFHISYHVSIPLSQEKVLHAQIEGAKKEVNELTITVNDDLHVSGVPREFDVD